MFNLQGLNSADTKLVQADKAKDAKAKAEAKEPAKEDPKAKLPGATAGELDMIWLVGGDWNLTWIFFHMLGIII